MDIFLIVLGLVFLIASMALILNPPEAWVKKAFLKGQSKQKPAATPEVRDASMKDDSQTGPKFPKTPQQ